MRIASYQLGAGQNITVNKENNVMQFSFTVNASSSATFLGNQEIVNLGGNPTVASITMDAGSGLTLTAMNTQSPINGIILTCVSGTVNVIMSQL